MYVNLYFNGISSGSRLANIVGYDGTTLCVCARLYLDDNLGIGCCENEEGESQFDSVYSGDVYNIFAVHLIFISAIKLCT